MKYRYFDTHCHLNIAPLKDMIDIFVKELEKNDSYVNVVGTQYLDNVIALKQAKKFKNVFCTLGIHPTNVQNHNFSKYFEYLEEMLQNNHDKNIIAIGETGFDFFYCSDEEINEQFEIQKQWFLKHYKLAQKYNLPLVIHVRNAHEQLLEILKNEIVWYGIIHCYNHNLEITKKFLNLPGHWMFGFNGIITYKNTKEIHESLELIPLINIICETDAPWLPPHPFRDKINNPTQIPIIIENIAKIKNISIYECQKNIWKNSCSIFNLNEIEEL